MTTATRSSIVGNKPPQENQGPPPDRSDIVFLRDMHFQKYLALNALQTLTLDIAFYPMEMVRTRLQVQDKAKEKMGDMFRMFRSVTRKEGFRGLFRGLTPSLVTSYPGHLMYYVAFEWFRNSVDQFIIHNCHMNKNVYLDVAVTAFAGLSGEAVSGLFWIPGDIISQRLQIKTLHGFGNPSHRGTLDVFRSIMAAEGIPGFYRAYLPSILIYGPATAIWWGVYEFFKNRIHRVSGFMGVGLTLYRDVVIHVASGCCAGCLAAVYLNPLEVARTRYQVLEATNSVNIIRIRRGFIDLLVNVARNEGLSGLYRGFLPRLIVSMPGTSLSVAAYEFVKRTCIVSDDHFPI